MSASALSASSKRLNDVSPEAVTAMQELKNKLRSGHCGIRVWEKLFDDRDREVLKNDMNSAWQGRGTVQMWRVVKGGSVQQAVVELAEQLDMIKPGRAKWLRRELKISHDLLPSEPSTPNWSDDSGRLTFGGREIRKVRLFDNPTRVQLILRAFQQQGWPKRIANPLSLGQQQLHQSLRSLNKGLTRIVFHAQEGAKAITWELA